MTHTKKNMKILSITIIFLLTCPILFGQMPISFSPASNGQTFNTCNGFIIDSGGQGGSGYSNNENTTITICPDTPGDIISVVFNLFNLSTQDDNPAPNVTNVDYMTVYDGPTTAANTLGTYSGNQLQAVVIQATIQNTSGCLTFVFTSNTVGTGMFTGSATCETPCSNPQAGGIIVGGITPDSINVCVGDEVFFQEQGSFAQPGFNLVDYSWDFMDGTTGNGQAVSHIFNVPGQYRVQLFVTDDNGCSNPNLVDLEVLVGTIPTFAGFPADGEVCLGESVQLVADPDSYEEIWNGFPGNQSVDDGCLTDNQLGVAQNIDLLQTGFSAGTTIANVNDIQDICLEMEHSFIGDLVVILTCPNGQNVVMHQQGGGGVNLGVPVQADNVDCTDPSTQGTPFQYCFTPTATDTWVSAIAGGQAVANSLPAGNYASVQPLDNLVGCPTNGVWTLSVVDNWAADDGVLFSFGLTLDPSYYPAITTFEPQIGLNSDSSYWTSPNANFITNTSADGNTIDVLPTSAGVFPYTFFVQDNFGCEYDSTMMLTVTDNASVFAGNDTTICLGESIDLQAVFANASGGCDYTLLLEDTFGDGWNGNNITVTINGVATNYTLTTAQNSGDWVEHPLVIPNGTNVQLTFNANGNWVGECEFSLLDEAGNVVGQGGPNMNGPVTVNVVANCAPDYVFDWQASTNLNDGTIEDPIWTPTGNETLTLNVYPIGHPLCVSTDDISVVAIAPPYAGVDGTADFCSNTAPEDLINYLSNNPDAGGVWTDPNGVVVNMPFDPSSMIPGVYTYTLGGDACVDMSTVTVSIVVTEITSSVITDVSCNSANDGEITITGTNIDAYSLNGNAPVPATSPFTVSALANGDYELIVGSVLGCSDTLDFTITQPEPLQITSILSDTIICSVGDATLSATGTGGNSAYTYTWSLNGAVVGVGQTIVVNPLTGVNNYCVELSEVCGSPVANACMNVTVEDEIIPSLIPDIAAGCQPHSVNFTNASNGNIASTFVSFGDGSDTTIYGNFPFTHVFQDPMTYDMSAVITSDIGCVYMLDFDDLVEAYPTPFADFKYSPNKPNIYDTEVDLSDYSSGEIVAYQWDIEQGTPNYSQLENVTTIFPEEVPGSYDVTLYVTTNHGCVDSVTHQITIVNDVTLFAPNSFTPDGDEFNQTWMVTIAGTDIYNFHLIIYNRWGEMIWESHDASIGWDGTYNGKKVQSGAYTWTIEAGDLYNDNKYYWNGHLNVLK